MKITVENTIKAEVEIKLPHYRKTKSDNNYYSVIDEENIINIEHWSGETCIRMSQFLKSSAFSEFTIEITKEEFDTKLAEVKLLINAV